MAAPIFRAFSGFQPEARAAAVGKAVAGSLSETPLSPEPFLRPWGPSEVHRLLTPSRGMGLVYMKSVPETRAAFSSTVICCKICSISTKCPLRPLFSILLYTNTGSMYCIFVLRFV